MCLCFNYSRKSNEEIITIPIILVGLGGTKEWLELKERLIHVRIIKKY